MMDLKTLKDLNKELEEWHNRDSPDWVMRWLRTEAINWVRHKRQTIKEHFPDSTDELINLQGSDFVDFFNLTEEELK